QDAVLFAGERKHLRRARAGPDAVADFHPRVLGERANQRRFARLGFPQEPEHGHRQLAPNLLKALFELGLADFRGGELLPALLPECFRFSDEWPMARSRLGVRPFEIRNAHALRLYRLASVLAGA